MQNKQMVVFHMKHNEIDKDRLKAIIGEHGRRLAQQQQGGQLEYAGPCLDHSLAILVYKGETTEEVEAIAREDPLYKNGIVDMEVHPFVSLDDILRNPEIIGRLA